MGFHLKVDKCTGIRSFAYDRACEEPWFKETSPCHSPLVFMRPHFPTAWLGIEITESLLLDDQPIVLNALHKLRRAGVTVALDDFGTDYSAMGYLKKNSRLTT